MAPWLKHLNQPASQRVCILEGEYEMQGAYCYIDELLALLYAATEAVANARRLGVGLGASCADVVESLDAILKRAYNDHSGRGGGGGMPGATELEREGEEVSQVWEWWFLSPMHPPFSKLRPVSLERRRAATSRCKVRRVATLTHAAAALSHTPTL